MTPVFLKKVYELQNYQRSNQDTCRVHRPIVQIGEWVEAGDILADSASSDAGELALGQNILVAYLPWEGYNYEDAILISERLVREDLYTSIHIEKYETSIEQTEFGWEEITSCIHPTTDPLLQREIGNLNGEGLVEVGTVVSEGDILVGKVKPLDLQVDSPYQRLMYAVLKRKRWPFRDTSLRVPRHMTATVMDVKITERKDGKPASVQIYLLQKRRIQVGDKMAGRHGNKGIISKILPRQDMPYLPDGTPVDMVLNPLGVPSRMNVGQIYECLLGLAGKYLGENFQTITFDEKYGAQASRSLVYTKLYEARQKTGLRWLFDPNIPGKTYLFDGRTGECFSQAVTVGIAYMLKLVHMVDDKITARSSGPYSLVTQQPLRGRSKQGGQRVGEMEVWAVEGYGAAYTLLELLTLKSDNIPGRLKLWTNIVLDQPIPLGTPESFKVLVCELQALCLDIRLYRPSFKDGAVHEISVNQLFSRVLALCKLCCQEGVLSFAKHNSVFAVGYKRGSFIWLHCLQKLKLWLLHITHRRCVMCVRVCVCQTSHTHTYQR
jgi:DNA-directed RNA polymerase subunit beta